MIFTLSIQHSSTTSISSYYDRIFQAGRDLENTMSCIMDGMAQTHCSIPWEANQHSFGKPLKQHLQGVLEHHKRFVSLSLYLYIPSVSLLCVGVMEETIPRRGPLGDGPFNALFPREQTLCGGTVPHRLTPNTTR